MNLSHFEVLSEKSLYKKRKRRDFASQVEEEKQQEELSREDVLRLNKIHTRYQQAEIEDFIEAYMHDDHMEVKDIDIRDEESFEKLILAYDYSTRRNSKYKVIDQIIEPLDVLEELNEETRMMIYPCVNVVLLGDDIRRLIESFSKEEVDSEFDEDEAAISGIIEDMPE